MIQFTKFSRFMAIAACMAMGWLSCNPLSAWQSVPAGMGAQQPVPRNVSQRYTPRYMRPAAGNMAGQPAPEGNYPVRMTGYGRPIPQEVVEPMMEEGQIVEEGFTDASYFDEGYASSGDDCGCGRCPTCLGGNESDCYNCGPAVDCRDCGVPDDCWMKGLGGILCNSEYFFGAQGFKNQVFRGQTANLNPENCGFGLHAGFNSGLPLYWLTCGLVSGQIGANVVHSNFEDGFLASGDRQQTFFTAGLFRRVDYGLQFGAVVDILSEDWVTEFEVAQMRSELSWVWSGGANIGFRWHANIQDDFETVGDVELNGIQTIDNYRLFYRYACCEGGYAEAFYGRTDEQHSLYGVDFDLPISASLALQTGLTYMQPDDDLVFSDNEAWNLFLGISFRPRGRDWYDFYHRPLFDVADNGSMILSRN